MLSRGLRAALAAGVAVSGALAAGAATWFVDDRTCPAVGFGSGTQTDPYCDIQVAIDQAQTADVVKVLAGVYSTKHTRLLVGDVPIVPNPAKAVVFMRDQVHLEGAGAGQSVLDAGGADRVVVFHNVSFGTRFTGFTVTGGDVSDFGDGAGLLVLNSSPTISRNHVVGNRAFFGGGIAVLYSSPTIDDNLIERNTAGNDIQSSTGGGIDVAFSSNPTITRNFIVSNYVAGSGGGLSFYESYGIAESNRVEGNVAEVLGGGVYSAPITEILRGDATLRGNVISLNVSREGDGGGVFAAEGTDLILNTVTHNRAPAGQGGGVYTFGSQSISLRDNLIYRNDALAGGGVYFDASSNPTVATNDTFGNLPEDYAGSQNPGGTQGNFSAEPRLLNAPDFVADVQIDRFLTLATGWNAVTNQFAVGDVVEYGNDAVPRVVTLIRYGVGIPLMKLETDPIVSLQEALPYPVVLRRWGSRTRLAEDYRTHVLSPLIDVANTVNGPPTDALGYVRSFDGDLNGTSRIDVGAAENFAELPSIQASASSVSWTAFPERPAWHYHVYRGSLSGLVDANKDGVPEGPDRQAGTGDDGFGDCLLPGVPLFGSEQSEPQIPAPGQGFFYLGQIGNITKGTLGFDSAGRERVNLHPCD